MDSAEGGVEEGAEDEEDDELGEDAEPGADEAPGADDEPAEDGLLALPEALPEALPDDGGVLELLAEPPDFGALDEEDLDASLPQAASANAAAAATRSALVIRFFL